MIGWCTRQSMCPMYLYLPPTIDSPSNPQGLALLSPCTPPGPGNPWPSWYPHIRAANSLCSHMPISVPPARVCSDPAEVGWGMPLVALLIPKWASPPCPSGPQRLWLPTLVRHFLESSLCGHLRKMKPPWARLWQNQRKMGMAHGQARRQ